MVRTVVAAVDDLFFGSKIKEAAASSGVELLFAVTQESAVEAAATSGAKVVIVDLHGGRFTAPDLIRALKADGRTKGARVVGYFQHEIVAVKEAAEGAGADQVLPRSAFVKLLPKILAEA